MPKTEIHVDAGPASSPGCFLSIRSSCDRCRVQKLKCSVPSGSGACERCTRAKIPCVFGRRNRSKRQSSVTDDRQAARTSPAIQATPTTIFPSVTSMPTPAPTLVSAVPPKCELLPTSAPPYVHPVGSVDSVLSAVPDLEPPVRDMRTWDTVPLGLQGLANNTLECDSDMASYSWSQSGFDLFDVAMVDNSPPEPPPWPSHLSLVTQHLPAGMAAVANSKFASINISTAVHTPQRLLAIISEIQLHLRQLEESPWHADSARSLDDYPVGTVLQLSQQFGVLASLALNTSCSAGVEALPGRDEDDSRVHTPDGSEDGISVGPHDDDLAESNPAGGSCSGVDSAGANAAAILDTPTILLLLSGYMWLVRIFDVVLGHFQKHLNRMPSRGSSCCRAAGTARNLRVGDLHYANAALSLQRIHIAVSMLLDALHDVEGHLSRGGKVVRDLVVAQLLNNAGRRQDGSGGGLGKTATAVKELLREKMGL